MKRTLLEAVNLIANEAIFDFRSWLDVNPTADLKAIAEEDNHYSGNLNGAWLLAHALDSDDEAARRVLRDAENEIARLSAAAGKMYSDARKVDVLCEDANVRGH
jgi:hypothetical protein